MKLTRRQVDRYAAQIPKLSALEMIDGATVGMLPWVEKQPRMAYLTALRRQAGMKDADGVSRVSADQVRAWFAASQPGLRP